MRFAYWFTVDRHAFQARDDKAHTLSLRGASEVRDAAIHHVSKDADGGCGSLTGSQWIATGLCPRDDKAHTLSLREASEARDAAIHRVSKDADGGCGSLTGSQWIATPFRLAMTRGGRKASR